MTPRIVEILANNVSLTNSEGCTMLGFADDPANPVNYIVLQISDEPDDDDISHG